MTVSSIHSIIIYSRGQMFEKGGSSNKNEWLLLSASFTAKFEFFCLNTGKCFFLEFSF